MPLSARTRNNLVIAATLSFVLGASSVHCGSGGGVGSGGGGSAHTFPTGGAGGSGASSSGSSSGTGAGGDLVIDAGGMEDVSQDVFYQDDPPPMTCNTDAGATPPVITGTLECPSDKNLPGCPCPSAGLTAPCWTGLRKDRGHGICHDGTATCTPSGETQTLAWGDCLGQVLPQPGATSGKAACECFSGGHWQIDNLMPCFLTVNDGQGNTTITAYAATPGNPASCPYDPVSFAPVVPPSWSNDTLKVDCTGVFTLCYTIKSGDSKNPQPSDCVLAKSCTTGYYGAANVTTPFPPLPGWSSDAAANACVGQFMSGGGYGEMSVDGMSDLCEGVSKVFQRVTYCPLTCNENPNAPGCAGCTNGGGGNF